MEKSLKNFGKKETNRFDFSDGKDDMRGSNERVVCDYKRSGDNE